MFFWLFYSLNHWVINYDCSVHEWVKICSFSPRSFLNAFSEFTDVDQRFGFDSGNELQSACCLWKC